MVMNLSVSKTVCSCVCTGLREGHWDYSWPDTLVIALDPLQDSVLSRTLWQVGCWGILLLQCSLTRKVNALSCLLPPCAGACCPWRWSLSNRLIIHNSNHPSPIYYQRSCILVFPSSAFGVWNKPSEFVFQTKLETRRKYLSLVIFSVQQAI